MDENTIVEIKKTIEILKNVGAICHANNKSMRQSFDKDVKKAAGNVWLASNRAYTRANELEAMLAEITGGEACKA